MNTDKINEVKDEVAKKLKDRYGSFFQGGEDLINQHTLGNCTDSVLELFINEAMHLYAQRQSADSVSKGETVFRKVSVNDGLPKSYPAIFVKYEYGGWRSCHLDDATHYLIEEVSPPQTESKPVGREVECEHPSYERVTDHDGHTYCGKCYKQFE